MDTITIKWNLEQFQGTAQYYKHLSLAKDGKLNKKGIPNLFHTSIIGLAHKDEIRLTKPPWVLQNIIYQILAPFGKLMGYRADYKSQIP